MASSVSFIKPTEQQLPVDDEISTLRAILIANLVQTLSTEEGSSSGTVEELEALLASTSEQLISSQSKASSVELMLETEKLEAQVSYERTLAELQASRQSTVDELEEVKSAKRELEANMSELTALYVSLKSDFEKSEESNAQVSKSSQRDKGFIANANAEIVSLKAHTEEAISSKESELVEAQRLLGIATNKIGWFETQLKAVDTALDFFESELIDQFDRDDVCTSGYLVHGKVFDTSLRSDFDAEEITPGTVLTRLGKKVVSKLKEQSTALEAANKLIEEANNERKVTTLQISSLKSECSSMKQRADIAAQEAITREMIVTETCASLSESNTRLKEKCDELEKLMAERNELSVHLDQAVKRADRADKLVAFLETELDLAKATHLESVKEFDTMQFEITRLLSEKASNAETIERLNAHLVNEQDKVQQLKVSSSSLFLQNQLANESLEQARNALLDSEKELQKNKLKLSAEESRQSESIALLSTCEAKCDVLATSNAQLVALNSRLQLEITESKEKAEESFQALKKAQRREDDVAALEVELGLMSERLMEMTKNAGKAQSDLSSANMEILAKAAHIERIEKTAASLLEEQTALKFSVSCSSEQLAASKQQILQLQATITSAEEIQLQNSKTSLTEQRLLAELNMKVEVLEDSLVKCQEMLELWGSQLSEARCKESALTVEVQAQTTLVLHLQQVLLAKENEHGDFQIWKKIAESKLASVGTSKRKTEKKLLEVNADLISCRAELASAKKELTALEGTLKSMESCKSMMAEHHSNELAATLNELTLSRQYSASKEKELEVTRAALDSALLHREEAELLKIDLQEKIAAATEVLYAQQRASIFSKNKPASSAVGYSELGYKLPSPVHTSTSPSKLNPLRFNKGRIRGNM